LSIRLMRSWIANTVARFMPSRRYASIVAARRSPR
jgi:hypothetical protein